MVCFFCILLRHNTTSLSRWQYSVSDSSWTDPPLQSHCCQFLAPASSGTTCTVRKSHLAEESEEEAPSPTESLRMAGWNPFLGHNDQQESSAGESVWDDTGAGGLPLLKFPGQIWEGRPPFNRLCSSSVVDDDERLRRTVCLRCRRRLLRLGCLAVLLRAFYTAVA